MILYLCIGIHVALRLFGYCDFSFEIPKYVKKTPRWLEWTRGGRQHFNNSHHNYHHDNFHDRAQGSQFLQELATEWPGTLLNLRLTCKRSPPPWFASSSPSSLSSLLKSSSSPPCSGLQHLRVRTRRCCVHVQAADEDAQQPSQGQGGQGVHLRGLPEHQLQQVGQVL